MSSLFDIAFLTQTSAHAISLLVPFLLLSEQHLRLGWVWYGSFSLGDKDLGRAPEYAAMRSEDRSSDRDKHFRWGQNDQTATLWNGAPTCITITKKEGARHLCNHCLMILLNTRTMTDCAMCHTRNCTSKQWLSGLDSKLPYSSLRPWVSWKCGTRYMLQVRQPNERPAGQQMAGEKEWPELFLSQPQGWVNMYECEKKWKQTSNNNSYVASWSQGRVSGSKEKQPNQNYTGTTEFTTLKV